MQVICSMVAQEHNHLWSSPCQLFHPPQHPGRPIPQTPRGGGWGDLGGLMSPKRPRGPWTLPCWYLGLDDLLREATHGIDEPAL